MEPNASPALDARNEKTFQTLQTQQNSDTMINTSPSTTPQTPQTPTIRKLSHTGTSPLQQNAPLLSPALRRASSATGLNERPKSSPGLMRKSSRTSLGAQPEDGEKRLTPKRSISNLISGLREAQTKMESIEEPVPLTAPQIAVQHLTRELSAHEQPESASKTVVILHDACYGHRYSRPKTSKTNLSMIVERPERIHASILGASTAYVRLGGHHAGAKHAPHPQNLEASPPPFKIRRTSRSMDITSSFVTNVHGTAWMSELRTLCNAAGEKLAAGAKELSRSSTPTEPEKRKLHEGDLYLSTESLNAFQGALGGVADAVDAVFTQSTHTKRAFVAIRPPGHHCSADHPSGFCWLNNVHVGIEYAAQTHGLTHAVILDFDLHHGDGSQAITWQRNSSNNVKRLSAKPNSKLKLAPDIGYYSLHDINSYPCEMGDDEKVQAASLCIDNAHGQSIWNVHLQPWKTEKEFWELYGSRYRVLLEKAREFLRHHSSRMQAEGKVAPKAAVFISAGFDASEWEGAGMQRHKVNVPTEFYARFTRDAVDLAQESGLACDGRVVSVLEGGYSDRALCSGVLSHLSGLCAAPLDAVRTENTAMDGLDQMMRGLGINGVNATDTFHYNKTWWSPANLTALEMQVNPPPPLQAKKVRVGQQPTYATPTESFAYKVVDANKFARSISGTMREIQQPARPPTPPPPEVDWVIATQELSKLLIPANRQTKSCTPEELAVPKPKKELASTTHSLSVDENAGKPRQLRDRKTKGPAYAESTHSDELESVRSASRSSRRQTIAELPSASAPADPLQQRRASRRLSAGSTLSSLAGDLDSDAPPVPSLPRNPSQVTNAMPPPTVSAQGIQAKKPKAAVKKDSASSAPASPKRTVKPPSRLSGPATNTTATSGINEVDSLTAGMKKVTLKAGTREEHDRKQKERVDAERRARALKAAETRKANAAAKKAAKETSAPTAKANAGHTLQPAKETTYAFVPAGSESNQQPTPYPLPSPQTAHQPNTMLVEPTLSTYSNAVPPTDVQYHQDMEPDAAAHMPPVQHPVQQAHYDQSAPGLQLSAPLDQPHINSQSSSKEMKFPGEPAINQSSVQEHSLAYPTSPPHVTLPSAQARSPSGTKLPVWSSTGVIPFAANGSPAAPNPSLRQDSLEIGKYGLLNANGIDSNLVNGHPSQAGSTDVMKTEGKERSIWDVPDTPQR